MPRAIDRDDKGRDRVEEDLLAVATVAVFALLISPALGASGGMGKGTRNSTANDSSTSRWSCTARATSVARLASRPTLPRLWGMARGLCGATKL